MDREEFLSSWNLVKTEDEEKAESQAEAGIESGALSKDSNKTAKRVTGVGPAFVPI
jgi:hypothetical protein